MKKIFILLGVILTIIGLVLTLLWPILIPALLLLLGHWQLALVVAIVPTIINTIRFRTIDIFNQHELVFTISLYKQIMEKALREEIIADIPQLPAEQRDNDFFTFIAGKRPTYELTAPVYSTSYPLTLLSRSHTCMAHPLKTVSDDKTISATITHVSWQNYWLFQKHEFHVVFQRI